MFRPDPTIGDGRWANNGWLQELPKPLTKLSWDNAALLSPALARRLGVENEDIVELRYRRQSRCSFRPGSCPGRPRDRSRSSSGHGRRRAGKVGTGVGVDVYGLRTAERTLVGNGSRGQEDERAHPAGGHASSFQHGRARPDPGRQPGRLSQEPWLSPRRPSTNRDTALTLFEDPEPQKRARAG